MAGNGRRTQRNNERAERNAQSNGRDKERAAERARRERGVARRVSLLDIITIIILMGFFIHDLNGGSGLTNTGRSVAMGVDWMPEQNLSQLLKYAVLVLLYLMNNCYQD